MSAGAARLTISASIVSAELLDLREELGRARDAGVDRIHVDIEDGAFVPVMNLGTRLAESAVQWGGLPVDVHLMVEHPEEVIRMLDGVAVDSIAIHAESTRYPRRVLGIIRSTGRRAGLALNPASPLPELAALDPYLDYVLLLTTEPEDIVPAFLGARLAAIEQLSTGGIPVVVDGGVDPGNAGAVAAAGAAGVVVGRALFGSTDMAATVTAIRAAAE
ncbi:MAG: hypothetical protein KF761_02715 [Salinibacterium sp.]|nr:hypothetical protein [Salinibacterium sp.]